MDTRPVSNHQPLGPGAAFVIGLTALVSAVGYLGFLTWILGTLLTGVYGSDSRNPEYMKISHLLVRPWFLSMFFGNATTPVALILAVGATFLPIGRRAKIIVWIIALGGALGWLIAGEPLRHGW